MSHTVRAYVALGANLGDALHTLQSACAELAKSSGITVLSQSSFHCTDPVGGPPGQPQYWNAVVELDTCLSPLELLDELQRIEQRFGRDRSTELRWGPRTLDLDLLLYGDESFQDERLEVPHPRLHERSFVLEPLEELVPHLRLPSGHSVREQCALLKAALSS